MLVSKIRLNYRQFGFRGFCKRMMKSILRKIGIGYESYFYLVNEIDYEKVRSFYESRHLEGVRELTIEDYMQNPQLGYTGKRLQLQKKRFEKTTYKAYGVEENDKLVYACMISLDEFCTSQTWVCGTLKNDEGFMLDAYCAPEARGRGIHGTMNAYRLMKLYELGKRRCGVVVVCENKPALKSQLKVGYKIAFKYHTLEIGNKHWTNFNKKYQKNNLLSK